MCALDRISDAKRTVPAPFKRLERDDLPCERRFHWINTKARWPVGEDGWWQVSLATDEIRVGLGQS
jgi:hypothetical protein